MSFTDPSIHAQIVEALCHPSGDLPLLLDLHLDGTGTLRHLGCDHPLQHLLGREAAPECVGLALISPGEIKASDRPSPDLSVGDLSVGNAVHVAQVVMADGRSRCFVAGAAGSRPIALTCEHDAGLLPDAMRRALGLPTSPPDLPVSWYWAVVWIAELLRLGADAGVEQIASWHPAIDPRELAGLSDDEIETILVCRHLDHSHATGWEGVLLSAAEGWLDVGVCSVELAAWFDAGSFCRWLSSQLPDPFELLETTNRLFGSVGRRLTSAILLQVIDAMGRHREDPSDT